MKVILLQNGNKNENRAQILFERLVLDDEKDELTVIELEADDIYEDGMIYADRQACSNIAGYITMESDKGEGNLAFENGKCSESKLIVLEAGIYENMAAVRLAEMLGYSCFVNAEKVIMNDVGTEEIFTYAYQTNMMKKQKFNGNAVVTMNIDEADKPERIHPIGHKTLKVDLRKTEGEYIPKTQIQDGLETAKTVIVCGNGAGRSEDIEKIKMLADKTGASVGATRPVAANGLLSSDHLIGISGKSISPEICLVLGASGSQAFLAGISKSKKIISVNTDPSAQIFENSDEAIVGDSKELVDKLLELMDIN